MSAVAPVERIVAALAPKHVAPVATVQGIRLEAGELHITSDLYERIVELCGWAREGAVVEGDPESSASMNFAAGHTVTHP